MADTSQIVARVVVPALGDVGYTPDYLRQNYQIPNLAGIRNYVATKSRVESQPPLGRPDRLDVLAFTNSDKQDWSTSAVAVDIGFNAAGAEASENRARALFDATAAPTAIVGLGRERADVWFNCHNGKTAVPVTLNAKSLRQAFRDHQVNVQRERLAELRGGQRHLFENHLYALRRDLVGYLHRGIQAAVAQMGDWWSSENKRYLTKRYSDLRVAFSKISLALLAARILEDKGALGLNRPQSTDARKLLADAAQQWDSFFDDVTDHQLPALDEGIPDDVDQMLENLLSHLTGPVHFGLVTHEMLGDLYEQADLPARRLAVAKKALFTDEFRLQGVHYTPFPITRRIVERIPFEDLRPAERLTCDLTCGSGSFLVSATDRLAELHDPREAGAGPDPIAYLKRMVCGNDLDEVAPLLVKLTYLLAYWGRSRGREGIAYPNVVSGDAIHGLDTVGAFGAAPSIFVGNPPFDSKEPPGNFLKRAVELLWKRERGTRGFIGMVMPQTFLKALKNQVASRKHFLDRAQLLEVWELPEHAIGQMADVSTCVVIADVRAGLPGKPRLVRVEQTHSRRDDAIEAVRDAGIPTWSYAASTGGPPGDSNGAIAPAPFNSLARIEPSWQLGELVHMVWGFSHTKATGYSDPEFASVTAEGYVPFLRLQSALRPYTVTESDWLASHTNDQMYWKRGSGPWTYKENWPHYESPKIVMTARGNPNKRSQLIAAMETEHRYPGKDFIAITLKENWEQLNLHGRKADRSNRENDYAINLDILRWLCAILNSSVGHAWQAVHAGGRGGQADVWHSFPLPAFDDKIVSCVKELERIERPRDLADTPTWDPPTSAPTRAPRGTPSLPGMEEEQPDSQGNAYWEIVREINQRVFESYDLGPTEQSQIITFLRSMTDPWAAHTKDVAELPAHTELRVMQGTVRDIDPVAQTITLKLSWAAFRREAVTIPIPKFMPGWALEEGREFTCRAPHKTTLDQLRTNAWLLRDFRPLPYRYLSVSELEQMLGYDSKRTDKT